MSLVLDGTGTISGLNAGGLPAGSVIPATTQPGALPSMIRVNTGNGVGSANTAIRRFLNITNGVNGAEIQGADISVSDSATLGALFTINTSGVYAISYDDQFNGASWLGVSRNTSTLTATITTIPLAERLVVAITANVNQPGAASWTGYLAAGALIRAHVAASAVDGTVPAQTAFTIARVA